jgi:hypothetical protein
MQRFSGLNRRYARNVSHQKTRLSYSPVEEGRGEGGGGWGWWLQGRWKIALMSLAWPIDLANIA